MKNKLITVLLSAFILTLWSCKKEENKVFIEGATPPVLSASVSGPLVLLPANQANEAVKLSWTNPEYRFTTGISSQDVNYTLQVDTTGGNFSSKAFLEISIAKDLSITYNVKAFNGIFSRMDLLENIPHNIELRIKASLNNNAVPIYSNVLKLVVNPYLDVAVPIPPSGSVYITGSAVPSDWTNNPPASQKFTKISNTEYKITMSFVPGKQYKFLSTLNQWQPQYGGKSATGGDLGYNFGGGSDPDAIPTPSTAGTYTITVNFKTGKYTVQ